MTTRKAHAEYSTGTFESFGTQFVSGLAVVVNFTAFAGAAGIAKQYPEASAAFQNAILASDVALGAGVASFATFAKSTFDLVRTHSPEEYYASKNVTKDQLATAQMTGIKIALAATLAGATAGAAYNVAAPHIETKSISSITQEASDKAQQIARQVADIHRNGFKFNPAP